MCFPVTIARVGSESGDDARLELKTTNGTFTIQNDRSLGTSGALTFAGNTSDNLVIDHNSGNVGINTSSPTSYANSQAALVIQDTSSPAIVWSDTGQAKDWFAVAQGSGLYFNYADGGGSGGASNVTDVLVLDNSGNVGIGTDDPDSKLHVKTGTAQNDTHGLLKIEQTSTSSGSSATNAGITTKNHHGTSQFMQWEDNGLRIGSRILTNSGIGDVVFTAGSDSEKMRITSNGFIKHSNTGTYDTYSGADDSHQFVSDDASHSTLWVTNTNTNYATGMLRLESARTASSAFNFLAATTGNLTDDQFLLRGDGNAYADGSWNGGGADYAEY